MQVHIIVGLKCGSSHWAFAWVLKSQYKALTLQHCTPLLYMSTHLCALMCKEFWIGNPQCLDVWSYHCMTYVRSTKVVLYLVNDIKTTTKTNYDNGTPHTYLLWSYWRNVIDKQVDVWYNFHTFCLIYFLNMYKNKKILVACSTWKWTFWILKR